MPTAEMPSSNPAGAPAPAVSIVLPTFNRAYCIRRAIDSVLNQTFANLELIVVDDGSTDETADILGSYEDPRLFYLRNTENKGVSARLNDGIRAARAALVAIQDSDDEWLPEKLAKQVVAIGESPLDVGVVYCDRWRVDGSKRTWSQAPHFMPEDGLIYERALNGAIRNIANQCLLVRRECFEAVGYFDEKLRRLVDMEMLIRLSTRFRFRHVPEPLVNYYVTGDSVTMRGEEAGINTWTVIYEKYRKDLARFPRRQAQLAYWIGSYHMRAADGATGRTYLADAFRSCPTNLRYAGAFAMSLLGPQAYGFLHRHVR